MRCCRRPRCAASRWHRVVLGLGVGGLLGWAAVTPLDRAVIAAGTLTAETRRKTITLLEPGILRELLVREGEQVVAGQPLLRLDSTQAEAAATQARALVTGQSARAARLRAEQMDARTSNSPQAALEAAARTRDRRAGGSGAPALRGPLGAFDGSLSLQRTRIAQAKEQIRALPAQRWHPETRCARSGRNWPG